MDTGELRHHAPLTWNTRDAPLHNGGRLGSAATWRERAAMHREALGLHKPARASVGNANCTPQEKMEAVRPQPQDRDSGIEHWDDKARDCESRMTGDISSTDLIANNVLTAEDEEGDADEFYNDDWWGLAMRVDVERFIAYKNAQLRVAAQTDTSVAFVFENTAAWAIMSEILSWERGVLRRHSRGQCWPDTMLSPAGLSRDQVNELKILVERWRFALEDADGTDRIRATLQLLPVDFALQQLIADALVAAGESQEARWALLLVVGAASPEQEPCVRIGEAQFAPPRTGWDDRCKCNYTKAQQCVRFGRMAMLSAESILSDSRQGGQESTAALSRIRASQNSSALAQEISSARRHLVDARKLYKVELAELDALKEYRSTVVNAGSCLWGAGEASSFAVVLRCGYLGATALLGAVYALEGRTSEAQSSYNEAIGEASSLLADPFSTPRLQRLLAAEREKMWEACSQLQSC